MKIGLDVLAVVTVVVAVMVPCCAVKTMCRKILKRTKSVIDVKSR